MLNVGEPEEQPTLIGLDEFPNGIDATPFHPHRPGRTTSSADKPPAA